MNAYSRDLRERIVQAIDGGQSAAEVAERFAVGGPQSGALSSGRPQTTWPRASARVAQGCSRPTRACASGRQRCRGLAGGSVGREKKPLTAGERDEDARARWRADVAELPADRVVFLAASSPHTTLTPRSARAPNGERANGQAPRNNAHTTTLGAVLTLPAALDGRAFVTFVAQILGPTLPPGQIVFLENLRVPIRRGGRALIEQAGGHLHFRPTSSPDCNPIEHIFSTVKERLRRLSACTDETRQAALTEALATLSSTDAAHGCAHCRSAVEHQPF